MALSGYMARVTECNDATAEDRKSFVPLRVGTDEGVGYVRPDVAERLKDFSAFESDGQKLSLAEHLLKATPEERTAEVGQALEAVAGEGFIRGWRNELFPVVKRFEDEPMFSVERCVIFFSCSLL